MSCCRLVWPNGPTSSGSNAVGRQALEAKKVTILQIGMQAAFTHITSPTTALGGAKQLQGLVMHCCVQALCPW